jgi:hypothetical protein
MSGDIQPPPGSSRRTERPVQTAIVWAPKVLSLEGEYLLWDANRNSVNTPGVGLLEGFLHLAGTGPDEILRFARKWGALDIKRKPAPGLRFLEPIAAWRNLAIRFRSLHRIGAELNCDRIGAAEDWKALVAKLPAASKNFKAIEEARFVLMSRVGQLVREAHLCPRLYWNKSAKQWQIDFDTFSRTNLFAVLVLHLMVAVANKEGFALCSGCHRSYIPEKQPSTGRRNYCPDCRSAGVPFRDSKREQRRRTKEANQKTRRR